MMRALFSGVSGLKVHQTKMDVIGNNIANVNTVGFKSSSVRFSDVFYQTTQSATGANEATGSAGRNATQIGLGSSVNAVYTSIAMPGGSERTDNPLDIMIKGDAFFIVNNGGGNYFTRAGSFTIDAAGNLCNYSGYNVMGWQVDRTTGNIVVDTVKPLQIMAPENLYSPPKATTASTISGMINRSDETLKADKGGRMCQIEFYDALGYKFNAKIKVTQLATPSDGSQYSITLEDILESGEGKNATSKSILTSLAGTDITFGGSTYKIDENGKLSAPDKPVVLAFNPGDGKFVSLDDNEQGIATLTIDGPAFRPLDIDFSSLAMYGKEGTNGTTVLGSDRGDSKGNGAGRRVGEMIGVSVDTSGKIFGSYDNGDEILLGQIAVTTFNNPAGLEAIGDNLYAQSQNSGEFDGIGQDPTAGGGGLNPGILEMSNVDLSTEFTQMITTQRGFQANSRIITTSDTMLEELINLKR